MISANRCCIICRSDYINIIEIQKSQQEYLSALVRCQYSVLGCKTMLLYKDIYMHELGRPFKHYTCLKCKRTNLLPSFILQHKNLCEHEETSCPECNLIVIRKELEEHSKTNCLYNLTSCISCKMSISNMNLKAHSIYCKINLSCKARRTSHLYKHKYFPNKPFKRITKWKELTKNYYLYYFRGKNLHVQNKKLSESFFKELYNSYVFTDAAFYHNSIFVCGGYDHEYLDTCAILNIESKAID